MNSHDLRHRARRSVAALAVVAGAAVALATVVVHADVDRLAALADAVVDGQVEKRAVVFEAERGAVWTTYEIAVGETLLGAPVERVTVHVPGGAAGGIVQEVSGTARPELGRRVVLFLSREEGRLLVLGEAQGCFRVERDEETKELVCRNDLDGLALVDERGRDVEAGPTVMRLGALRERVLAVAASREEAQRRRREERERRLAELRRQAERNAERTRGKPGGAR